MLASSVWLLCAFQRYHYGEGSGQCEPHSATVIDPRGTVPCIIWNARGLVPGLDKRRRIGCVEDVDSNFAFDALASDTRRSALALLSKSRARSRGWLCSTHGTDRDGLGYRDGLGARTGSMLTTACCHSPQDEWRIGLSRLDPRPASDPAKIPDVEGVSLLLFLTVIAPLAVIFKKLFFL